MRNLLILTVLASAAVIQPHLHAENDSGTDRLFPEDAWGVYSWASWVPNQVNRETHPLIKGGPMILRWNRIEPREGDFMLDEEIGRKLKLAEENGFYTFLTVWVAPDAPRWLYDNGVPEVEMTPTLNPLGKPRDWTFQYYLDEDYITYYHRMLTRLCEYIKGLPLGQRERILFIQSAEGSTGDGWGYKGSPLDPQYEITDEQWGTFRIKAWDVMKAALSDETGKMVVPMLVNYDSNREEQYNWVMENLPAVGLKNGMFSHGYHISDTKSRLSDWKKFRSEVEAAGKVFFSRGEQDAEYKTYGWSTQNIAQGLYWSAIFATHCGLDMWNVPWQACAGTVHADAINFFNKYAGHHVAATSPAAFCALRKGLDASDTTAYPESEFGKAHRKNIERYLKIAEAFSQYGAIQGDPPKAIGGGMLNRKRQDYNDVGWGILDGNHERFLTQIQPEETSVGWWHKGPAESIYSRFARGTDVANGKAGFFFDLDDAFFKRGQKVEIRVVWLDEGTAKWTLRFNSPDGPGKPAFLIQNSDSGKWCAKTIVLDDFQPANAGPLGADLFVHPEPGKDIVLHLLEVTKL
jgi:hypothetical protein